MSSSYSEIHIKRDRVGRDCILGTIAIKRPFGGGDVPFLAHCLELPWHQNRKMTSCIPPGRYPATIRTDGARGWRVQLEQVKDRTYIQIHAGNYPSEIDGCILPGLRVEGNRAVMSSKMAMKLLKDEVYKHSKNPNLMVVISDTKVIKSYAIGARGDQE